MKRLTVVVMAVAAFGLMTAAAAQAGTAQKATGSIVMANPKQAITFDVFKTTPVKGNIAYTNFEYADPGSGVWVPGASTTLDSSLSLGSFDVQFSVDPNPAIVSTYTFTVNSITPLSPTSLTFSGNGVQQFGPWDGPFTGTINGSAITFTLSELNGAESYTLNATGTIDANGSVAGSWIDNYDPLNFPTGRTGKIAIADVGDEAFSFTTTPTCVNVLGGTPKVAKYGYTIPTGAPAELAGQPVAVKVTDGGSSGALNDTYEHDFANPQNPCEPTDGTYQPQYPITAGNLTIFS